MKDFKLGFWQTPFVFFMIPMVIALIAQLIFYYINVPLMVVTAFIFLTAYKIVELMTDNFHKYIDRKLHEYIDNHKKQ